MVDNKGQYCAMIKIKTGRKVKKRYSTFGGGINKAHITFLTSCSNAIQDKDLQMAIKGYANKVVEATKDLEILGIQKSKNTHG